MSIYFEFAKALVKEQDALMKITRTKRAAGLCMVDGCTDQAEFPGTDFCPHHSREASEQEQDKQDAFVPIYPRRRI
jgi:hypothetical protein